MYKFLHYRFWNHSYCSLSCHFLKYLNRHNYRNLNQFTKQKSYITENKLDEYNFNLNEFLNIYETRQSSNYFRNLLYPTSDDEIINKLKLCESSKEIFKIIDKPESCSPQQLAQAVLVLRYFSLFVEAAQEYNYKYLDELQNDFNVTISSPSFTSLVNSVIFFSTQMTLEELSFCLLNLCRLNVDKEKLTKLITNFENIFKNTEKNAVPISCLTRFCISVRKFDNIWSLYTFLDILPLLLQKLDYCDSYVDFERITICFQNMVPLLNSDTINKYINKCSFLLKKSEDANTELERLRTIVEVLSLLNFKIFVNSHQNTMKQLLLSIHGGLKNLSISEILTIHQVLIHLNEPYQILNEIQQIILQLISNFKESENKTAILYIRYLYFIREIVAYDELKNHLINYTKRPLNINEINKNLNYFYFILLNTKTKIKIEFSDIYWTRIVELFIQYPALQSFENLVWICQRYIKFAFQYQYCHKQFENLMCSCLYLFINDDDNKLYKPSDFAKCVLFLLYFEESFSFLTNSVWERIIGCIPNLNIQDNSVISFLLNCIMKRNKKSQTLSTFFQRYVYLNSALNRNSLEYLMEKDLLFDQVNLIFHSYNYRQDVKNLTVFELINNRLVNIPVDQMNFGSIRKSVINYYRSHHVEPIFVDNIVQYSIKEKDTLHSISLFYILKYLFIFGYIPNNSEMFIDIVMELINRDGQRIYEPETVQTALALCYFNRLPSELINFIFNVKFLENLNKHIHYMSSKYQMQNISENLMELNRTVCIEYPNQKIPWFHEKYCLEKRALEPQVKNFLFEDIFQILKGLVNVEKSVQVNCYTPYHHKIDIVLYTNRNGEPINPYSCTPTNLRKIAILLNDKKLSSYYKGKGKRELNIRHLEMLGYKVVVIDKYHWSSMCMSEPLAKENYLNSLLWPS